MRTRDRSTALYGRLVKLCRARGCSPDDARDAVQEAHARLLEYQRSATVKDTDSILRRIVVNITTNRYHSEQSAQLAPDSLEALDRRGALVHPGTGPERTRAA